MGVRACARGGQGEGRRWEGREAEGLLLPSAPDGLCCLALGCGLRASSSENVEVSPATPGVSSAPRLSMVGVLAPASTGSRSTDRELPRGLGTTG